MSAKVNLSDPGMRLPEQSPYEDGTNILLGTPHIAEFTARVLPWDDPTQSTASSNWKEKWSTLRSLFERLIDDYVPVECFLIQRRLPAFGLEGNELPPGIRHQTAILDCGGTGTEPAQLFAPHRSPLAGTFPIKSARGEAMRNTDGTNLAFRFGFWRRFVIQPKFGWSGDFSDLPVPVLNELATDATQLLYQLPQELAITILAKLGIRIGTTTHSERLCGWTRFLNFRGKSLSKGPLHSRRYAWQENFSVQLTGNGLFPRFPMFQIANPNVISNP